MSMLKRSQTEIEDRIEDALEAKAREHAERCRKNRWAVWVDFAETTTLHGPNHLTSTSGRTRIYYIVVVTFMSIMFLAHATYLFRQYLSYPILTEIKYGNIDYSYPVVTLCPNSPFTNRSITTGEGKDDKMLRGMLKDNEAFWWAIKGVGYGSPQWHFKRSLLTAFHKRSNELGRKPYQHVLECQINKMECLGDFIITEHPIYYRCFTLRVHPKPPVPSGPTHGIRIILHRGFPNDPPLLTVVEEAAPILQSSVKSEQAYKQDGYFIAFHEQGTFPNFPLQYLPTGISLRYGQAVTIGLEQTHYQSVSLTGRPCVDPIVAPQIELVRLDALSESNANRLQTINGLTLFNYTREACIAVLRQKLTFQNCGCFSEEYSIPYSLRDIGQVWCHDLQIDTARIIRMAETLKCVERIADYTDHQITELIQPSTQGDGLANCPYTCNRKVTTVHSLLQRSLVQNLDPESLVTYFELLQLKQLTGKSDIYVNSSSTGQLDASDLIFLDIHPVSEIVNQIIESSGYYTSRFLSDLGGISGLYVGITIYTLPELFDLLIQFASLYLPQFWFKTRIQLAKKRHTAAQLERRMALEEREEEEAERRKQSEEDEDESIDSRM